jgi:hypothetical protein
MTVIRPRYSFIYRQTRYISASYRCLYANEGTNLAPEDRKAST